MLIEDVGRTVAFYRDVLGFEVVMTAQGAGGPAWALVKRGGVELMFQARACLDGLLPAPLALVPGGTLTIYVEVDDVEAFYRRVAPVVPVVRDLHDTGRGTREFSIRDCNGFILTFAGILSVARRAA